MGRARTGPGRPRTKKQTPLSAWLDENEVTREEFAAKLDVTRPYLDKLCRGDRRPSLEIALLVEKLTKGEVPVSVWQKVAPHSSD